MAKAKTGKQQAKATKKSAPRGAKGKAKPAAKVKAKANAIVKVKAKPAAKSKPAVAAKPAAKSKPAAKKPDPKVKAVGAVVRTVARVVTTVAAAVKKVTAPSPGKSAPRIAAGDKAPSFELKDQAGNVLSSASLKGKPYVLYFYPKDDTSGCTREACGFRDSQAAFGKAGARVIGVSPDSEASHAKFAGKYGLPFTLLSDPDKVAAKAYGAWGLKQNYGREYWGIIRSTFVVDAAGKVKRAYYGVKVDGHVDSVLAEVSN